jgi:hypothetical protein
VNLREIPDIQNIEIVMPRETNHPENIAEKVLSLEEEVTDKLVRTVLIEAIKPL